MARSWGRRLSVAALVAVCAVTGVFLALVVTPSVSVTVFGQDLRLGAVSPWSLRGLSGPGQADLFGEGPVDTALQFQGPVRPSIVWQRFDRDPAAAEFIQTSPDTGPTFRTQQLGQSLADGWTAYFVRLVAVSAVLAAMLRLMLFGGGAVLRRGGRGGPAPAHGMAQVLASLVTAALLATASTALAVVSTRDQLASVRSLADITGTAPLVPTPAAVPPSRDDVELAVIGDSTAAAVGNAPVARPGPYDETCGRSQDAYAMVLASALRVGTINLACSSATIANGLLGPQGEGDVTIPPQVGVLKSLSTLRVVVVGVGANDIGWSDFLRLCYGLERCDDQLGERLFESRLDYFRIRYAQLLQQLSSLPTHPEVVVVQYYDPFGTTFDCPALQDPNAPLQPPPGYGFAASDGYDQQTQVRQKIAPLRSELTQLNAVLAEGASAFGFRSVAPSFAGHALCDAQPWVQGMAAPYPFHPNAAGELAIAAGMLPTLVGILTPAS